MNEHAPHNALTDPDEIARFYDRCSELMRELLEGLAAAPGRARTFPDIEDALGWPRRRTILEFTEHAGDEVWRSTGLGSDWSPAEAAGASGGGSESAGAPVRR